MCGEEDGGCVADGEGGGGGDGQGYVLGWTDCLRGGRRMEMGLRNEMECGIRADGIIGKISGESFDATDLRFWGMGKSKFVHRRCWKQVELMQSWNI